jgi:hypothetical protein
MDKIDRFFRERFTNFEQKPEDQVWIRIASSLMPDKRRKFIYLFVRIAAGMTLLLSLGVGFYLINRQDKQHFPLVVSQQDIDKAVRDSLPGVRARKSQTLQPEKKKARKSDRLQPVRRIYKGPEMMSLLKDTPAGDLHAKTDPALHKPAQWNEYPDAGTVDLILLRKTALIPVALPVRLDYPEIGSKPETPGEPV